jgi:hypothetical protein
MQTIPRMRHHQDELIRKRHLSLSEIPSEASMYHDHERVGWMHPGWRNWPNKEAPRGPEWRDALATPDIVAIFERAFFHSKRQFLVIIARVGLRNFDCSREPVALL